MRETMAGRELTGNHYLTFPAIERQDGAIPVLTALHSGLAGVIGWWGDPLLRCELMLDGELQSMGPLQWERLDRWIPRARATVAGRCELVLTVCAPAGYDPLVRGGFIDVELRSTSGRDQEVQLALAVNWRSAQLHVRGSRPLPGALRVAASSASRGLALEAGMPPFGAALGLAGGDAAARQLAGSAGADLAVLEGDAERAVVADEPLVARLEQRGVLRARRTQRFTFYLGLGRDRESALANTDHLRRLGPEGLLRRGRFALSQLVRRADDAQHTELLNRHLLFNHFFAVGRGLDDDRLHAVASRSPLHGATAVYNERDTLFWTLPALTLNDPLLARELLVRAFEVFTGAPAQPGRYIDGGILAAGFVLDQLLAYPLALDRYAREAEDESILDDPIIQDVLREIDAALYNRLHRDVLLADTELLNPEETADFPYPTLGNVLLWAYCKALPRIWRAAEGEPPPAFEGAADEVAAAVWQRCTVEVDGVPVLVSSTNLQGEAAVYDDPTTSLALLPYFGFCEREDPIWRNTMELLRSNGYPLWHGAAEYPGLAARSAAGSAAVAGLCCELVGGGRERALRTLRTLKLPDGVACERYDPNSGEAAGGPHAAALAGFVAWTLDRGAPSAGRKKKKR